ncbi:hypothetical protein GCM10023321_18590 [Pseudonocardia eucalypti]|uniref:Uncharacterized protein n=1 Tax=Pseudonocardia eucalypti TaxID=648755 RepID=A0ABP9PVM4_9PSEU|nr:hypothetical protein [Pseudonocardia eucalypti]
MVRDQHRAAPSLLGLGPGAFHVGERDPDESDDRGTVGVLSTRDRDRLSRLATRIAESSLAPAAGRAGWRP